MNDQAPLRFRISYAKGPAMRFTGHLDLQRAWERTFRRANLPMAYTQGYNPHARLQLGPALPLGCTSECELLDIWLEEPLEPTEIVRRLVQAVPPGIQMGEVRPVDSGEAALQNQVTSTEYTVVLAPRGWAALEAAIAALLAAETIERTRRNKTYDLRPLVESLSLETEDTAGGRALRMTLASREGATGRPEEVLLQLDLDPAEHVIHRTRLLMQPLETREA